MSEAPKYIIYAPSYDENNGGCIVLHKLCHTLNQLGEKALLCPMSPTKRPRRRDRFLALFKPKPPPRPFLLCDDYDTPVATADDLSDNSIVVYPEIVAGNPVGCKNVVRWFLHKPGYHSGVIDYGENELYFIFDDFCDDKNINDNPDNKLRLTALNPAYYDHKNEFRSGSCYLIRKGKGKEIVHDLGGSIKIDRLSHSEIAEIFNKSEIFYSYDEATMYSQFAALCGCVSVVIPTSYSNRETWVEVHPISKFGIAYGLDDIEHAVATRTQVRGYFDNLELESTELVKSFIAKTYDFYRFHLQDD